MTTRTREKRRRRKALARWHARRERRRIAAWIASIEPGSFWPDYSIADRVLPVIGPTPRRAPPSEWTSPLRCGGDIIGTLRFIPEETL